MAKFLKIFILLLWVGLMVWVWNLSRTWPVPEKIEAAFLPDYNDYHSLSYSPDKQKIGWGYNSLRRLPQGGGYQVGQGLTVHLKALEQTLIIQMNVMANLDQALNLIDYTYVVQVGPFSLSESGRVKDGQLHLTVNLDAEQKALIQKLMPEIKKIFGETVAADFDLTRTVTVPVPSGPGLSAFIPAYLAHLGLKPNRNYSLQIVDPVARRLTNLTARVEDERLEYNQEEGRDRPMFQVGLGQGGGESKVWLDRFGRVWREEMLIFQMAQVESQTEAVSDLRPLETDRLAGFLANNDQYQRLIRELTAPGGLKN